MHISRLDRACLINTVMAAEQKKLPSIRGHLLSQVVGVRVRIGPVLTTQVNSGVVSSREARHPGAGSGKLGSAFLTELVTATRVALQVKCARLADTSEVGPAGRRRRSPPLGAAQRCEGWGSETTVSSPPEGGNVFALQAMACTRDAG